MNEEKVLHLIDDTVKTQLDENIRLFKQITSTFTKASMIQDFMVNAICELAIKLRQFIYENETYYVKIGAYYFQIETATILRYYKQLVNYIRDHGLNQFIWRKKDGNNLIDMITLDCQTVQALVNPHEPVIPLLNGFYFYETGEFKTSFADKIFTIGFTVPWEDGDCPGFKKFMQQILPDEKDRIKVLSNLAYCMTIRNDIQISQIWTGRGNDGKSTLANIVKFIMGGMSASFSMRKIMRDGDRFTKTMLRDARLNIGSEIGAGKKMKSEEVAEINEWQTAKECSGEVKNNKNRVDYVKITKTIYDINNTPTVSEWMGKPFFRRFDLIYFLLNLDINQVEHGLDNRLYKEEGPQIFRYIMSFYKDCTAIISDVDWRETKRKWIMRSHSVFSFLEQYEVIGEPTPFEDVYDMYSEWCREHDRTDVGKNKFSTLLRSAHRAPYRDHTHEKTYMVPFSCSYRNSQNTLQKYAVRIFNGKFSFDLSPMDCYGTKLPSPVIGTITVPHLPKYVIRVVLLADGSFACFKKREVDLSTLDDLLETQKPQYQIQ